MMSTPATAIRRLGRHGAARLAVRTALLATVAAACATTTVPAPVATPRSATGAPAGTPQAAAETTSPGSAGSPRGATAAAVGPPSALLVGAGTIAVPGTPGSFSWDGLVSDAPWVAGTPAGAAAGSLLAVTLEPSVEPIRWQARWAPLVDGQPGDPRDGGSGSGGPIEVETPSAAGAWSLLVSAVFGEGRSAAWSWWVDVSP